MEWVFPAEFQHYFSGKRGLEIGGPSLVFHEGNIVPIYNQAATLDNCNFSEKTIWDNTVYEGIDYSYDRSKLPGRQMVMESSDLYLIDHYSYDFVISSHVLEHVANPLKSLCEWSRVLKPGGVILFIVPNPELTFDHHRDITSIRHLVEDYVNRTQEDDLTHYEEILLFHDTALDPGFTTTEEFCARSKDNVNNRCFHHHVFNDVLIREMVDCAGLKLLLLESVPPFNIIVMCARKSE